MQASDAHVVAESACGTRVSQAACSLEISSAVLLSICVALLLHHRYKHREGGPHPLHGMDQWFQREDVCKFQTCNHETWILFLMSLAFVLLLISFGV